MRKGVVVDLDGTLLRTNTFKEYIIYVLKSTLQLGRLDIAIQLLIWVFLRKFRWITHEKMKYHILRCTTTFMNTNRLQSFVLNKLTPYLNDTVYQLCQQYRSNGYYICLSTAAPESYVNVLFDNLNLDSYCASRMPNKKKRKWRENVREQKCENTLSLLHNVSVQLSVMITDHHDDLPLLERPKEKNFIVDPTEKTLSLLNSHHIDYYVIK